MTAKPATTAKGATPADAIKLAKESGVQVVDVRFTDLPGTWQHFSIPVSEMTESLFAEGIGFDGSSIRGFQAINESDMLLFPDPASAFVDPCLEIPTLSLTCDIGDPITGQRYSRDPRYVAQKAEAFLTKSGIADTVYFGPEAEFYIFNSARFDQNAHSGYYFIDSEEGIWNSGQDDGTPNLAHRPRHKEGYFPVPPTDKQQDLRSKIMLAMLGAGIPVEVHHHEVGTAGQTEIDMRFGTLTRMGDQIMMYKYIVKNVCKQNGYTATFMPKPMYGDNGSGYARAHEPVEPGQAAVLRRKGVRHAFRHGAPLYRRADQARRGAAGVRCSHHQQLPPAGAGLRGADQPHVLGAQPRRRSAASRCTPSRPRPSASSSGRPIRRATRTSRLPPC